MINNMQKRPNSFLPLNEFVPQTFKLDEKNDRETLFNLHKRISFTCLHSLIFSFLFF